MASKQLAHTPGPWLSDGPTIYWVASDTGNQWIVARLVDPPARPSEETQANGRLIAAAPDLLEALRLMVDVPGDLSGEEFDQRVRRARAAIAKAEGHA